MTRRRRDQAERTPRPRSPRCQVTLEPLDQEGISPAGQRELAGGRGRFPSRVAIVRSDLVRQGMTSMLRMSISGMQDKISLRLERGSLRAVERDGSHILKPIPSSRFTRVGDVPANEQVTMLAAKRLGITVAACGLVWTDDDELAYITRRFDRRADGTRMTQEDFGSLAGLSTETHGTNWKYDYSYEGIGILIKRFCSAQQRDLREFFRRVVFCAIIGNGDAHVRNFSVLREEANLVQLSPAYDLLCTALHIPGNATLALPLLNCEREGGTSPPQGHPGSYKRHDFLALAAAIGVTADDAARICDDLVSERAVAIIGDLVRRSFLTPDAQESYMTMVSANVGKFASTT